MTVTDERLVQEFKQAYATLEAASPIPLDWEEASTRPLPLTQQPKAGWWRHPALAFASAAVLVAVAVALVALRPTTTILEPGGADQWRVVVFLAGDVTPEQIDAAATTLQQVDGVTTWVYVDQPRAFNEALAIFADDERNLAIIRENPSIIPASLRFATIDEASANAVTQQASELAANAETGITDVVLTRGKLIATGPEDVPQDTPLESDTTTTTIESETP